MSQIQVQPCFLRFIFNERKINSTLVKKWHKTFYQSVQGALRKLRKYGFYRPLTYLSQFEQYIVILAFIAKTSHTETISVEFWETDGLIKATWDFCEITDTETRKAKNNSAEDQTRWLSGLHYSLIDFKQSTKSIQRHLLRC